MHQHNFLYRVVIRSARSGIPTFFIALVMHQMSVNVICLYTNVGVGWCNVGVGFSVSGHFRRIVTLVQYYYLYVVDMVLHGPIYRTTFGLSFIAMHILSCLYMQAFTRLWKWDCLLFIRKTFPFIPSHCPYKEERKRLFRAQWLSNP